MDIFHYYALVGFQKKYFWRQPNVVVLLPTSLSHLVSDMKVGVMQLFWYYVSWQCARLHSSSNKSLSSSNAYSTLSEILNQSFEKVKIEIVILNATKMVLALKICIFESWLNNGH